MRYLSTRGNAPAQSFSDILLGGLAPDGGLYLPESYPQVTRAELDAWRSLSYAELAFAILLEPGLALLELSNGPTLAFKDMAMQLLGNLFEYVLEKRGEEINILGATSGDTGSAAEYAMRGKQGVRVFMLSPHGR
jgi:threonine synthase